MNNELLNIVKSLKNYMSFEQEAGINEIALSGLHAPLQDLGASQTQAVSLVRDNRLLLEQLKEQVANCTDCELCSTRRNTVFGEGSQHARLMLIGEAPGMEEDIQGRPFVGKAGKLLTKIIEAIGLKREDVFICNSLKCRPPKNRTPYPSEIVACRHFLLDQITMINPRIICCLGRPATQSLLMTDASISRMRGKFHDFKGIKVMPTFHPAYLLRNPSEKKLVWEDMKKIRDFLKQ